MGTCGAGPFSNTPKLWADVTPPRASTDPRGCSIPSGVHPRFGRRDLHPRQAAAGQGVRLSPPPRHPREDKAAVTALAGLRQGLSGGRGQERGWGSSGFRRGAGSFCGNVPDALQETKRTRSSRARASPGWKIPREVATAPEQGTSPTPFFPAQPPHPRFSVCNGNQVPFWGVFKTCDHEDVDKQVTPPRR